MGYKFLRQHPIFVTVEGQKRFFIADFYCNELLLVIELDGEIHRKQQDYDELRSHILKSKKINVIRFPNAEILIGINSTLIKLKEKVEKIEKKERIWVTMLIVVAKAIPDPSPGPLPYCMSCH
jgi:very-short-patch-repair endonuclease